MTLPIHSLVKGTEFEPEEISLLVRTFERICRVLQFDEDDDGRLQAAETVVTIARSGERNPGDLYDRSLNKILDQM